MLLLRLPRGEEDEMPLLMLVLLGLLLTVLIVEGLLVLLLGLLPLLLGLPGGSFLREDRMGMVGVLVKYDIYIYIYIAWCNK